ncbi:MAG: SIS domain-containing protein [bacterium]|nr:SIS domain-containing protein [bacterium]
MNSIYEQLKTGSAEAKKIAPVSSQQYPRIIFSGMGGSIMPAEALSMLWLPEHQIYLNRTAYLPHWATAGHLAVCISWSGNTEETINCFLEAQEKKIATVVITTGGKLAELAQKAGTPTILLPHQDLQPREALAMMLSALLTLLNQAELVQSNLTGLTLLSHFDIIENSVNSSAFDLIDSSPLSASIAQSIGSKTPLMYSSYPWRYLGSFWKILFNENVKTHAFFNHLPGAGHNEIAAIKEQDPNFFYLVLRDADDHFEDNKKLDQLTALLKTYQTGHTVVEISGANRFEKIIKQYALALQTSTQLAMQLGVDPHSIAVIEKFKQLS